MKNAVYFAGISILVLFLVLSLKFCGYVGQVSETISNEVVPGKLLSKYEWFKDAASQLDKKKADIMVYEARLIPFKGMNPVDIPRHVSEQIMVWNQEVAGIKASYNALAADYNAQMAKINWAFTNVGSLPKGAETPLPREYAPYIDK